MSEMTLSGKNVVVLGASRGVGREIVLRAKSAGARVLAVARGTADLERLAAESAGIRTLAIDAATDEAPRRVFEALRPDVLVVCGGAIPATRPPQELSWSEFTAPWETDVRMSFLFCTHALRAPLAAGSVVILMSSGAGLGGSPISGGYAGAKRMQMFLAGYSQKESARLGLGIRFAALVPMRIMPETDLGKAGVQGYARYLGIAPEDFVQGMNNRQSARQVADAIISVAQNSDAATLTAISGEGLSAIP